MASTKILSEEPLTLEEVKEKLEKIEKREREPSIRIKKTKEYLNTFTSLTPKKAAELKGELEKLEIPRFKNRHIVKIIDILPQDIDSLRTIFSGEDTAIKQENLKKILEILQKFK